jgi:hypothetical protein
VSFASPAFLAFILMVAAIYGVVPKSWRCSLLLIASYGYYFLSNGWFALLLLATTLSAFFAARSRSRALVAATAILVALLVFKSLPLMGINGLFPLGISYYTFKLAGYLIDAHWGVAEPERRLIPFLTYTAYFPQILAGPIQRAQTFLPQVESAERPSSSSVIYGLSRILLGLIKKFLIADRLGYLVDYIYAHIAGHPGAPVVLAFYGYPLQLYADFSALSDIAIGASALMGITSPENFLAPFSAPSPSEYWRRWHITLTQWMVSYVFTPLRMAFRGLGKFGLVISILINMIAIGLWHGLYWTFALFGAVHAIFLSVDALTQGLRKQWYRRHVWAKRAAAFIGPIVTFNLIAVAAVIFRADSIKTAYMLFSHLGDGWGPLVPELSSQVGNPISYFGALAVTFIFVEGIEAWRRRGHAIPAISALPRWCGWSIYATTAAGVFLTFCLLLTSNLDNNPFIYAVF